MKKFIFFISILLLYSTLFSVIEETDSFKGFLYGNAPNCEYDNWLSHVAEGIASPGYNVYAPFDRQTNGFGDYKILSSADSLEWNNIIELFLTGELDLTQDMINQAGFPYEVVIFNDTDTDRTYYILREIPDSSYVDNNGTPDDPTDDEIGAFTYGWGLYVFYPNGLNPHITTAPHPNDDFPSVPIAGEVFIKQESKFLLISGTGREVKWTHIGNYTNSKSLCDPSRIADHPFNIAYKKFCDFIRAEFGKREFSIQIHSYDWGSHHAGMPNVQISGGNQVINPDLPIRDNSSLKLDIVNATNLVVHPANDIGIHPPVYINDFYGIHCTQYPFTYSNDDTTFAVNTGIDLPGYSGNKQMEYTQAGFNQYDNIEPFFHIEMDEFPNCYPQNNENYYWFYSWDPVTNHFDYNHIWDKFIAYYTPWIKALTTVLPYMYQMNDNLQPIAPTNVSVTGECSQNVTISWIPGDSYDIYSYEILFANEPIENNNYQIIDRNTDIRLSSLATNYRTFYNLEPGQNYYFKIRIKDKNNNYSDLSDEIVAYTGSADVTNFKVVGDSTLIHIYWNAYYQNNCNGFNIYRKTKDTDYEMITGWQNNPALLGNDDGASYSYNDTTCIQGTIYTYKLSFENNEIETFYQEEKSSVARYIGKIIFSQDLNFPTNRDTIYFGYNEMASDDYEIDYDEYKTYSTVGDYYFCQFYEDDWNSHQTLRKEIKGYYDSENRVKTWRIRFRTNQLNNPVHVYLANYQQRNSQRVYLNYNSQWIDIGNGEELTFTPTSIGYYNFTLYYGNYQPQITFLPNSNILYLPNDQIDFQWIFDNIIPIDHINLSVSNSHFNIPVAYDLPPNTQNNTWTIPTIVADSLNLNVNLVMAQGDTVTYHSPYKFGILFPQVPVSVSTGWNLITKNFDTTAYTTDEIYGETAQFYQLQDDDFTEITEPEFLNPLWIYSDEDHYFNINNAEILQNSYQYPINRGWNIIPNPYKIDFDINQLIFSINGEQYQYYQAVNMHLIESKAFGYDNEFKPVSNIEAGKSYYLYSYYDDINIIYLPYFNAYPYNEFQPDWKVLISAQTVNEENKSSIMLSGSRLLEDNSYNPIYDILKPQLTPFENINFNLTKDFGNGEDNYYSLIEKFEPAVETVENYYNATLQTYQEEDIEFSIQDFNLPEDYRIYLNFNGDYKELLPQNPVVIHPTETPLNFQILVTNFEHLNSSNDNISSIYKTKNYPNPFNPTTTIAFYNDTANIQTKLEIYNLKGQLVKTLLNKKIGKGLQKIVWNGTNKNGKKVSSGVYFYKITRKGKKSIVKKMLMLK